MLGGSFWIAFFRNAISVVLMMSFFLMLDRPRFSIKTTLYSYLAFGILLISLYSFWYQSASASFIRFAPVSSLPVIGVFCSLMSREVLYVSLYKMALAFYLFSVCVFCSVDAARWWFGGNLWADIVIRVVCTAAVLLFTWNKFRRQFLNGIDFLIEEMDTFSALTLFVSVIHGAIIAYWPNLQGFSIFNMVRAFTILFLSGMLQYTILHLYIHLGREHLYRREKELLEINEKLLRRQMELMRESEQKVARIHHDVRHHTLLMKEYAKKGRLDSLMDYLDQYMEDIEQEKQEKICLNHAVSSILSAYAAKARNENIKVSLDVRIPEELPVRDIDWIAILANVFENAIHGCMKSGLTEQEISLKIALKRGKISICCRNSSGEVKFHNGRPVSASGGIGVSSILKTVCRYDGETDFSLNDGIFTARILLNLPEKMPA